MFMDSFFGIRFYFRLVEKFASSRFFRLAFFI